VRGEAVEFSEQEMQEIRRYANMHPSYIRTGCDSMATMLAADFCETYIEIKFLELWLL
jgi:hypothetical protein